MRLLPSDVRAVHLLPEDPDYTDEEDEVHLAGRSKPLGHVTSLCAAACETSRRDSQVWCPKWVF